METREVCNIKISLSEEHDDYYDENWVKNLWPYMLPWFTKRHGVKKGKIELNGGLVEVEWEYTHNTTDDNDGYYIEGEPL